MYEDQIYNSRKIRDFTDILRGFDALVEVTDLFCNQRIKSALLKAVLLPSPVGKFPSTEIKALLAHFRLLFDEKQAKKDGFIRPLPGVDSEYDAAVNEVSAIEKEFEEYLKAQKRDTGINDLAYFGSNKDRFQLEVPMARVGRVPRDWTSKSQKKTHRRYWTPFIEEALSRLNEAEDRSESVTVTLIS
jgi:DNA mismatch repair protein MSH6